MDDRKLGYPPSTWADAAWPVRPYPLGIPRRIEEETARLLGDVFTEFVETAHPLVIVKGDGRMMASDLRELHKTHEGISRGGIDPYKRYDPVQDHVAMMDQKIREADAHARQQENRYRNQALCCR